MPARLVGSVSGIVGRLGIAGGRIRRAVNDQIMKEAETVRDVAKRMVPIEDHDVERAIIVEVEPNSQRRLWRIGVKNDAPAVKRGEDGQVLRTYTVGEYAMWLHEATYKLGPLSRMKDTGGQHRVGRKYIERAFTNRFRSGMMRRIERAARQSGVF